MSGLEALALLPSLTYASGDGGARSDAVSTLASNALAALAGEMTSDAACAGFAVEGPTGSAPAVFQALKRLYADALFSSASDAKFAKVLAKLGLPDRTAAALAVTLQEKREGTLAAVRNLAAASSAGSRMLEDFDWSVQHVVSSDKLNAMKQSHVALSLRVSAEGDDEARGGKKDLVVELSSAELDALIAALEKAVQ